MYVRAGAETHPRDSPRPAWPAASVSSENGGARSRWGLCVCAPSLPTHPIPRRLTASVLASTRFSIYLSIYLCTSPLPQQLRPQLRSAN